MIFPSARTLCSVFLLGLISTSPINVIANPDGAGTCNVADMSSSRHGPSVQSKGATPYSITSSSASPGSYKITLSGSGNIKGLLLYAVNSTNQNTRIGQFSSLPNGIVAKQCPGGPTGSTVNHNSPDPKPLPMTFQWSSGGLMQGTAMIKAIVVLEEAPGSWSNVQGFTFNLANGTAVTGTPNITTDNNQDLTGTTDSSNNQFFLVAFINTYPLFNVVAIITIFMYIVGALVEYLLKRQQVKARSQVKSVSGYIRQ